MNQMTDGEHWPAMPTDEELTRISGALIAAGRNALPIKIEGAPLASTNPRRDLVHIEADEPAFVRMWLAASLHRTLDGYEATLVLRDSGLDLDARAHVRIAFEHLCAFAWIAATPSDKTRPLRIGRYGMAFYEKQMVELSQHHELSESQLRELGFAIQINKSKLKKPPSARALREELDRDWSGSLPEIQPDSPSSFSSWYSYLFRGASAFVHPTSAGIEPSFLRARPIVVEPSRRRERRLLELCAAYLSVAIAVASLSCPDLIDEGVLQNLSELCRSPGAEPN